MKKLLPIALACLALPLSGDDRPRPAPVVVELFTSEGCSSCPPAEDLLSQIVSGKVVTAGEVIPLSFHVDYWDSLGWTDRFGSPTWNRRQGVYTKSLAGGKAYTPQMVVGGREEFVGSDSSKAHEAISREAKAGRDRLHVNAGFAPGKLHVEVKGALAKPLEADAELIVVVTEDGLESDVTKGENKGRHLKHDAVVRAYSQVATVKKDATEVSGSCDVEVSGDWRAASLHAVALLQDSSSAAVRAAGTARPAGPAIPPLPGPPPSGG